MTATTTNPISCHLITWRDDLATGMREASGLGFHACETFTHTALAHADDPGAFRDLLASQGLRLSALYAGARFSDAATADATVVRDAARAAGVQSTVGFNYRNAPAVAAARELIASGELGSITHARFRFFSDYAAHPEGALSWRFERERGGNGVLGDLASPSLFSTIRCIVVHELEDLADDVHDGVDMQRTLHQLVQERLLLKRAHLR